MSGDPRPGAAPPTSGRDPDSGLPQDTIDKGSNINTPQRSPGADRGARLRMFSDLPATLAPWEEPGATREPRGNCILVAKESRGQWTLDRRLSGESGESGEEVEK